MAVDFTCEVVKLLGFKGCSQSPADPLDPQVGDGTLGHGAPHDPVVQSGEQLCRLGAAHNSHSSTNSNYSNKVQHGLTQEFWEL